MTAPLVELRRVSAAYDQVEVLHDIDLVVPRGQVLAVLGPNGAGKSTLLRVLAGLHRPSSGDLALGGHVLTGAHPKALARRGLCLIPEGRGVFANLTVDENLWMMTHRGVSRRDVQERAYSEFPVLAPRRDQTAGSMSGGEQQMLAIARALVSDPAVLLIDELSMGLAPLVVARLFDKVADIAGTGVTIVIVEQFVRTALAVADHAAVLIGGRIVANGSPAEIAPTLHSSYLSGNAQ